MFRESLETVVEGDTVKPQLSNVENAMVGIIGGIVECSINFPIITAKFCVQEGRAFPTRISDWYAGLGVQVCSMAPITASQIVVNGFLERVITDGKRDLLAFECVVAAFIAGAVSALIYCPAELLIIQQQNLKMNFFPAISHLRKKFGNFFFIRGLLATVLREGIYAVGYLAFAPILQKAFLDMSLGVLTSAVASGIIAGILAGIVTHPIDTVKTAVQADMGKERFLTALHALYIYRKTYGIGGLFKGFTFRTVRLCVAFIIIANLREQWTEFNPLK